MNIDRKYTIIVGPHISEKSARIGELANKQIAFKVARDANKAEIKQAIEELFNVKVQSVRTTNVKAKAKVFKGIQGKSSAWKKAYVALKEGFDINFSDEIQ